MGTAARYPDDTPSLDAPSSSHVHHRGTRTGYFDPTARHSFTSEATGRQVTDTGHHETRKRSRDGAHHFTTTHAPSSCWSNHPLTSSRFADAKSPPPLAHDRYELAQGSMEEPPHVARQNEDDDDYFQLQNQRGDWSVPPTPYGGAVRQSAVDDMVTTPNGSKSWTLMGLVGGVAGKLSQFCTVPFRGFQAGNGAKYDLGSQQEIATRLGLEDNSAVFHFTHEATQTEPFTFGHRDDGMIHVLLCASGSVATIKIPNIVNALARHENVRIRLIFTTAARNFLQGQSEEQPRIEEIGRLPNVDAIYFDEDEWREPWKRGDKILHIELRRWSDIMVIAPLSANELAKITQGWSDNLLLAVARAWDTTGLIDPVRNIPGVQWPRQDGVPKKRILVAPSMNTAMWFQPITQKQMNVLDEEWGVKNGGWFEVLQPMEKELACGDIGGGAMMDWREIVSVIEQRLGLTTTVGDAC